MKKFCIICFTALMLFGCKNVQTAKYEPVEGLNGEVMKVTTFSYDSDIEKSKIIALYGEPIPTKIECYNKFGTQTSKIEFTLDDGCYVEIDSTFYDKENKFLGHVYYTALLAPEDVVKYKSKELLQSSFLFIKELDECNVVEDKNKRVETIVSTNSFVMNSNSKDYIDNLKEYISNYGEYMEKDILPDYMETGVFARDTTIKTYEYKDGKIVHEVIDGKGSPSEITREYDDNKNIIKEVRKTEEKTIETEYIYKNGVLSEKREGDRITKYDEQGREIATLSPSHQSIKSYRDTTSITSTIFKYSSGDSYSVGFSRENQDGLPLFSAYLNLATKETYVDDAVILFENYRDGVIDEEELRKEMESIILTINDSHSNGISKYSYSDYDSHHNPLKIFESEVLMENSYSLYPSSLRYYVDKKVNKNEYRDYIDRIIEYY